MSSSEAGGCIIFIRRMSNEIPTTVILGYTKQVSVGAKINTREALKRIHRILDSFFCEEWILGRGLVGGKRGLLLKN